MSKSIAVNVLTLVYCSNSWFLRNGSREKAFSPSHCPSSPAKLVCGSESQLRDQTSVTLSIDPVKLFKFAIKSLKTMYYSIVAKTHSDIPERRRGESHISRC